MVDLEHLSLDKEALHYDPDARAWYRLELRGGELWATGLSYTPDGEDRVRTGKQKYLSPAFYFDPDTKEVLEIHNIGLVAIPATHNPQALCAASKRMATMAADGKGGADAGAGGSGRTGLEQLGLEPTATLDDIIAALKKLDDQLDTITGDSDGGEPDGDEAAEMSAAGAPPPPPANAPPADKKAAKAAMSKALGAARRSAHRALLSHTGAKTTKDAIAALASYASIVADVTKERAELAKKQAVLEANERTELVAKMVTLGKETPATAWTDQTATIPAEPWASMKLEALRDRVAKMSAAPSPNAQPPARANSAKAGTDPNANGAVTVADLSEKELASCSRQGIPPEKYAARLSKLTPKQREKARS
jgi:hypothetical protein